MCLRRMTHPSFVGYILKNEISYSLAWAVDIAMSGKWVITEGVRSLAASMRFPLSRPCVVLDGRRTLQSTLSKHQADVSRLAFLFSMERRELADELGVVEDWGYGLVSQVYEQFGGKGYPDRRRGRGILLRGPTPSSWLIFKKSAKRERLRLKPTTWKPWHSILLPCQRWLIYFYDLVAELSFIDIFAPEYFFCHQPVTLVKL